MIGVFGVVSIAAAVAYKHSPRNWNWKAFAPFALLFGLILIRTVIGNCSAEDHFYLEKSLSLLLLPLCFTILPFTYDKKEKRIFQLLFAISSLMMAMFGMILTLFYFNENIGIVEKWESWNSLIHHPDFAYIIRTTFEDKTGFHPTYAALYLGIAFNVILNEILTEKNSNNQLKQIGAFTILLLLLIFEILLASRTPFVAMLLCATFLIFMNLKNKKYAAFIIIGITIIGWGGSKISPSFSSRINEVSTKNIMIPKSGHEDSFNLRRGIIHCSLNIIKKNWLVGVRPGKVQKELNNCYSSLNTNSYENRNYNTHNQYFDYWAGLGILGPIFLLVIIFRTYFESHKNKLKLGMAICMLFSVCMITENLLIRQYGIISFSYFLSLYSFNKKRI